MSNFQNPKFSDADFADFGNPEKNNEERDSYEAYGNVYFAFLDVLGFKQAFDVKKNEEGDIVEKFKEVFIHFFFFNGIRTSNK